MQPEHVVVDADGVELDQPLDGAKHVKHGGGVGIDSLSKSIESQAKGGDCRIAVAVASILFLIAPLLAGKQDQILH